MAKRPVQDQVISSDRLQRDRQDGLWIVSAVSGIPYLISVTKPTESMLAWRPAAQRSRSLGLKQAFFAHDTHGLLQDADALDEPGQLVG